VLAAMGVAGVMAFMVAQRTREMGIRMALGAQKSDVFGLMLTQGLRLTALGVTRALSSMLFGVAPGDPLTFSLVSGHLIGVALVACYVPAHATTRVDPMAALRYE